MTVRVKICGITTPQDAVAAATAGADCIGLVFHKPSPRHLSLEQACAIRKSLPPFVSACAVVLNPEADFLEHLIAQLRPDLIQYHGDESPALCAHFSGPWIRAVSMREPDALRRAQQTYLQAQGFLLDSHSIGEAGGRGERFDWSVATTEDERPLILAGGLDIGCVADAIAQVQPWAVDVSSGVESSPGHKDPERMHAFIQEVRRVG